MYLRIAELIPRQIIDAFKKELDYLDIDVSERKFVGFLFVYGLVLSLSLSFTTKVLFQINYFHSFVFFFVLIFSGTYLWLSITAESRGKIVEKILPDALQLISSNMQTGLTAERALFVSARPEFGPLEKELKRVGKMIISGRELDQALMTIPDRIKSRILERTVWLLSKGVQSGGQLSDLLDQLSEDLRKQNEILEETKASVSTYTALIFFAGAIGTPVLFGVSTFIVKILTSQLRNLPTINPGVATGGTFGVVSSLMSGSRAGISTEFVVFFTMVALLVSCLFASMLMGVIDSGKEKHGMKYFPVITVVSFALFFGIRNGLDAVFGSLI